MLEYVGGASKAIQPDVDRMASWVAMQARRLKEGDRGATFIAEGLLEDLRLAPRRRPEPSPIFDRTPAEASG